MSRLSLQEGMGSGVPGVKGLSPEAQASPHSPPFIPDAPFTIAAPGAGVHAD